MLQELVVELEGETPIALAMLVGTPYVWPAFPRISAPGDMRDEPRALR
jgi:hypothetical protein